MELQPFSPVERRLDGVSLIYEHRATPDVDICPKDSLLCVNFQTQHNATYAYAGEKEWRGARHAGMAHLIEPEGDGSDDVADTLLERIHHIGVNVSDLSE